MKKQRWEKSEKRREREKIREEKESSGKQVHGCEKVGKSRFTDFFPMVCGPGEHLEVAMSKNPTCPSQHAQNTPGPPLEVEMFKSTRYSGAKHISKSKV